MKSLYIMGPEASGKTTVGLGLALSLQKKGFKVGYIKPISSSFHPTKQEDEDALVFKQALNLPYDISVITPLKIGSHYLSSLQKKEKYQRTIMASLDEIKKYDFDLVLIGGSTSLYHLSSHGLDDISLAEELQSPVLFVITVRDDYSVDQGIMFNRYLKLKGIDVIGNIFNNISRPLLDKVKGIHKPLFENQGHRVLGIIPASRELTSPTAGEFLSALGGELLTGEEYLDKRIDEIVVGAMTIEGALKYLRRSPNKAVILGGDRNDLALTALETSTSVLILTGGLYPNVKVVAEAEEKKVPVILVHHDTYKTIEQISNLTQKHRIRASDTKVIELAQRSVENHCDLSCLNCYLERS